MEKLNSCISNPKQFLKDLTTFCSNAYERNIIPVGYHSVLNQSKQPYLRIKTSRDETDPTVLGLQKNNFRPDLTKYFVKDDMFIFKMSPNTSTEKSQKYDRPITENQNYGVRFFSSYSQKPISQFMLLKYYRDLIDKVFPVELVEKDASVQFCRGFNLLVLEAYAKKSYLTLECLKLFLDKNIFKQELEEYTNVNKMLDHEDSFNLKASP